MDVIDLNGEYFSIRKIDPKQAFARRSCYEVVHRNDSTRFCYPQVIVVGEGKCGTSAMFTYLSRQTNIFRPNYLPKENCPEARSSFVEVFKSYGEVYTTSSKLLELNGCLRWNAMMIAHRLLEPDPVVYIYLVRNATNFAWAAYNFWCLFGVEKCAPGAWATKQSLRTPEHFQTLIEMPVEINHSRFGCERFADLFTSTVKYISTVTRKLPLVLAIEALETSASRERQLDRLNTYINKNLNTSIALDIHSFVHVNAGALLSARGEGMIAAAGIDKEEDRSGTYEISGFRCMLPSTIELMDRCWRECREVANLSEFPYKCK
jgi:hypothetical protein